MPTTKIQTNRQHYIENDDDIPLSTVRSGIATRQKLNLSQVNVNSTKGKSQKAKPLDAKKQPQTPPAAPFMNNGGVSSSRSSSTYIGNNGSYVASNRSSSNFTGSDYQNSRSRNGRGTPSSDGSQGKAVELEVQKNVNPKANKAKSTISIASTQTAQAVPQQPPASKKKGFSIFSFFKKTKKKPVESIPEAVSEAVTETMSPAEKRAEEVKQLRDEEFAKLRRQREKEKSRTIYDMLPSARYAATEVAESNGRGSPVPSLNSLHHYPQSNQPIYRSPQLPVNNIRSYSTNNLAKVPNGRPATTYSQMDLSPGPVNPQARDYFGGAPNPHFHHGYNPQYLAGHRSTDSVYSQQSRHVAPSPLIPHQVDPNANRRSQHRSSSYGGPIPPVPVNNHHSPMTTPNYGYANPKYPNQYHPSQAYPNQAYPNQGYSMQQHPNHASYVQYPNQPRPY